MPAIEVVVFLADNSIAEELLQRCAGDLCELCQRLCIAINDGLKLEAHVEGEDVLALGTVEERQPRDKARR